MAKAEFTTIRTPKGKARFVSLDREEIIQGKATGNIAAGITFEGEALTEITKTIEDYITDTFPAKRAKAVNRPFKTDKEGAAYLKFTTKAKDKDGNPKAIRLLDSKGNVITRKVAIGNGSVIKIEGSLTPTEFGGQDYIKCYLNKIKIIRLVEYVPGGDWRDDEDDEGEGGFVADEFGDGSPAQAPKASPQREPGEDLEEDDEEPAPKAPRKAGRADF